MGDEADKMRSPDPKEASPDSASESKSEDSKKKTALFKDLNYLSKWLGDVKKSLTPQFIENATREELHIKDQEAKNYHDLYNGKTDDLSSIMFSISNNEEKSLKTQRDYVAATHKQIQSLLET